MSYSAKESEGKILQLLDEIKINGALSTEIGINQDIRNGDVFTWQWSFTIADAATRYFWWDTTKTVKNIEFQPIELFVTIGSVLVNFYIGHDYSGGTNQIIYNRNFNSLKATETNIYLDPTGSNKGTNVVKIDVGTQASPIERGGGAIQSRNIAIQNNQVPFLVECINNSGSDTRMSVLFSFKEK